MQIQELEKDIEEVNGLLSKTERTTVKQILEEAVDKLKHRLKQEQEKDKIKQIKEQQSKQEQKHYKAINTFSFDQESKYVKVYISLKQIGELDKSQIQVDFKEQSVELLIHNYQNSNFKFCIPKLNARIESGKSKYVVKKDMIVITVYKQKQEMWPQLSFKDNNLDKIKDQKESDPQASLMNMMKNMYQDGDDQMKRTIAEAWTKSQDQKDKMPEL